MAQLHEVRAAGRWGLGGWSAMDRSAQLWALAQVWVGPDGPQHCPISGCPQMQHCLARQYLSPDPLQHGRLGWHWLGRSGRVPSLLPWPVCGWPLRAKTPAHRAACLCRALWWPLFVMLLAAKVRALVWGGTLGPLFAACNATDARMTGIPHRAPRVEELGLQPHSVRRIRGRQGS